MDDHRVIQQEQVARGDPAAVVIRPGYLDGHWTKASWTSQGVRDKVVITTKHVMDFRQKIDKAAVIKALSPQTPDRLRLIAQAMRHGLTDDEIQAATAFDPWFLARIREIREPIVTVRLYMPQDCVGSVMTLANAKRGVQVNMAYHGRQVLLTYDLPLAEIVLDFFDRLKSVSRGYASFDYEFSHFQAAPLVKLDILINAEKVDALSIIVHTDRAYNQGRATAPGVDVELTLTTDMRIGFEGSRAIARTLLK